MKQGSVWLLYKTHLSDAPALAFASEEDALAVRDMLNRDTCEGDITAAVVRPVHLIGGADDE